MKRHAKNVDGVLWVDAARVMMDTHFSVGELIEFEKQGLLTRRVTCDGGYLFYKLSEVEALLGSEVAIGVSPSPFDKTK